MARKLSAKQIRFFGTKRQRAALKASRSRKRGRIGKATGTGQLFPVAPVRKRTPKGNARPWSGTGPYTVGSKRIRRWKLNGPKKQTRRKRSGITGPMKLKSTILPAAAAFGGGAAASFVGNLVPPSMGAIGRYAPAIAGLLLAAAAPNKPLGAAGLGMLGAAGAQMTGGTGTEAIGAPRRAQRLEASIRRALGIGSAPGDIEMITGNGSVSRTKAEMITGSGQRPSASYGPNAF